MSHYFYENAFDWIDSSENFGYSIEQDLSKTSSSGSIPIPSVPIDNKSAEEIIDNLINKLTKISKNISIKENPTGIDILNSINSLDLLGTFNKDFHNVLNKSAGKDLSQLEYSKIINGEKDNDWPNKNDIEDLKESIIES